MIDFIPLSSYYDLFINVCLFIVILTVINSLLLDLDDPTNILFTNIIGYPILVLSIFYIGWRPISEKYFIDMFTYARHFEYYKNGGEIVSHKDVFFHVFTKMCAAIMSVNNFFLVCAVIYIIPMFIVCKKLFKEYWFYAFLIFIVSFQFWPYGVNGIRNGMATSLFLLGVSFYPKKVPVVICFLIGTMFHQSLLLPVAAFVMAFIFDKPKIFLYAWLAVIPLSLVAGSLFESLFTAMGFAEDRLGAYLSGQGNGGAFRFDFLLYSASAVFAGWYFIFKRGFKDKLYNNLYSTYLITNSFWILVIRANFSNRFAYLSWFMIGLIIIYPLLKERFYTRQYLVIGRVVFLYFGFTYFMYAFYY